MPMPMVLNTFAAHVTISVVSEFCSNMFANRNHLVDHLKCTHVAIKPYGNLEFMVTNMGVFLESNNNAAIWSKNQIDWPIL